jgi:hypothetical protein
MRHAAALGAYPTDSYYDPGRPSWLPFWIDTPTESAMKYGLYPGVDTKREYPAPPGAPGAPSPGQSEADQWGQYRGQLIDFYAGVDAETQRLREDVDSSSQLSWGLVLAAAILVGGVLLAGRM